MTGRAILDFLFPPQCVGCNALGNGLCAACAPTGAPIQIRLPMLRVTAAAPYDGTVRAAVLALKDGRRDVAEALGAVVAPLVKRGACLVPIPTTPKRKRERGCDGVALVAQRAAMIAGARTILALEQRTGDAQRGRSRSERLAAQGRFACDRAVTGRRVTLLDDVCTTGATLQDAAAAVLEAGGQVEDAVVVAVTLRGAGRRAPVTKSARPWRKAIFG